MRVLISYTTRDSYILGETNVAFRRTENDKVHKCQIYIYGTRFVGTPFPYSTTVWTITAEGREIGFDHYNRWESDGDSKNAYTRRAVATTVFLKIDQRK